VLQEILEIVCPGACGAVPNVSSRRSQRGGIRLRYADVVSVAPPSALDIDRGGRRREIPATRGQRWTIRSGRALAAPRCPQAGLGLRLRLEL